MYINMHLQSGTDLRDFRTHQCLIRNKYHEFPDWQYNLQFQQDFSQNMYNFRYAPNLQDLPRAS